jgi:hypothetical protein
MSIQIFNILINQSDFILSFNTNAKIVLAHITCHLFLNQKQYLICERILIHFLNYKNNQNNNSSSSQMLLYIEEKEEIKKSQIIKKIFYAMKLLKQKNQLIVMNLIEATIDNVNEFTIHSFLSIEINKRISKKTQERIRRL